MGDGSQVDYRRDGKVGIITISREPLNTYDDAFEHEFQQAWICAKHDDSRVVVLRAMGQHFCAGAELKDPRPAPAGSQVLPSWEEIRLIKSVTKPTIAAVQGGCIGGGQRMVWPCDLVFCSDDAFFRDPTADMGIGGIQAHLHTWFYGPRLAKEMIYSGMRLPAERLYQQGQVNRLYPDVETLHRETFAFAQEIAEKDPVARRQAKRGIGHHHGHPRTALRALARWRNCWTNSLACTSESRIEPIRVIVGVAFFLEPARPPARFVLRRGDASGGRGPAGRGHASNCYPIRRCRRPGRAPNRARLQHGAPSVGVGVVGTRGPIQSG